MTVDEPVLEKRIGLSYWMQEVLDQCQKVEANFDADPVHDLRTSLRRCRSMADGIRVFDRAPAWKKMRRAGKQLFSSLGDLRDTHVIGDWVEKLASEDDAAGKTLRDFLATQEQKFRKTAAIALQDFDRAQWKSWANELPERAERIPLDSPVFAHLALERCNQAYELHRRALRNRTNVAFHELRIGLKRFRYTLENFLPSLHTAWGEDLKDLQDLLGEVHDLDVLWLTALQIKAFPNTASRAQWRSRIEEERRDRLHAYREKMIGKDSLWRVWRASLPRPEEVRHLGLERLRIWASFLDPNFAHARHIARLGLQLYDGLPPDGFFRGPKRNTYREILQAAAFMHDVGLARTNKGHQKVSARLIRELDPPLGWTAHEIDLAALIARYHRGALPRETQRNFVRLSPSKRRLVQFLGGILRLACACDQEHDNRIRRVKVECSDPVLTIRADGYAESTSQAEHLAAARHLLELALHRPVFLTPLATANGTRAA
jgi:CHAD domain-containing protein